MKKVHEVLDQALHLKIGSGIAAAWGDLSKGNTAHVYYGGKESHAPNALAIDPHTQFDLASLTKVVATTSLYMRWVDQKKIDLNQAFPGHHHDFNFVQLLTHSSGLPAWKPFYESMHTRFGGAYELAKVSIEKKKKYFYELLFSAVSEPLQQKPGAKIVYSDLGFLLLSHFAEIVSHKNFDQVVQTDVWNRIFPKGEGFRFRPIQHRSMTPGIAATELCPWRGLLQGEVHDDNTWSMGGVAGHAGVFGTLTDVLKWMHALVEGKIASFSTLRQFSQSVYDSHGNRRALGFDQPSEDGSGSTANVFSGNSIGHLGFTGTSFWFDLDRGRYAILLTNRVHPSRDDNRIRDLRRLFHGVAFL